MPVTPPEPESAPGSAVPSKETTPAPEATLASDVTPTEVPGETTSN